MDDSKETQTYAKGQLEARRPGEKHSAADRCERFVGSGCVPRYGKLEGERDIEYDAPEMTTIHTLAAGLGTP